MAANVPPVRVSGGARYGVVPRSLIWARCRCRPEMELLQALPFVAMLLGIALLPLVAPHRWEHPAAPAVLSAVCCVPVVATAAIAGHWGGIVDGLGEYVAFIALIAALYVTAGGIHISGHPRGTPLVNTAFLGVGAVAASLIGTTGASMLLIRPLLDAN